MFTKKNYVQVLMSRFSGNNQLLPEIIEALNREGTFKAEKKGMIMQIVRIKQYNGGVKDDNKSREHTEDNG